MKFRELNLKYLSGGYIVTLLVDCPPQADIFSVSTHQALLKITIFEGFPNHFDPQIPKNSACGGLLKGNLVFPTFLPLSP